MSCLVTAYLEMFGDCISGEHGEMSAQQHMKKDCM